MGLVLTAPPDDEPVTLAEAKAQCRVDPAFTGEDTLLNTYIVAARRDAERYAGVGIMPQSWLYTLPGFPTCSRPIAMPKGPVVQISSITYLDPSTGSELTLDPSKYLLESTDVSDSISLTYGSFWPATRQQANAVSIAFDVGMTDEAGDAPKDLKAVLLMRVEDLFRSRGAQSSTALVANETFERLLNQFVRKVLV